MFERFSDRARKVMALTNKEAQRNNHQYISPEHILLGLIAEGTGVAIHALMALRINPNKIRLEVQKHIQSGPDLVTMGKLPQMPRAKKVIEYAIEESRSLNHNYVGTEHLLLGLLREHDGVAAQVLTNLGLTLEATRQAIRTVLRVGPGSDVSGGNLPENEAAASQPLMDPFDPRSSAMSLEDFKIRKTSRAKISLEYAKAEALRSNSIRMDTDHLLLGLIQCPDSIAAILLAKYGLTLEVARLELQKLQEEKRS